MEDTSARVHKMGKYSRCFCRRCSPGRHSNHQHVTATRTCKDSTERRQSGAHDCTGIVITEDHRTTSEGTLTPVYTSAKASTDCHTGGCETSVNCAKYSREYRPTGTTASAPKELVYRAKVTRSRSLADENRAAAGLLTRSTSCGDMCYLHQKDDEMNSSSSSGNESEFSDVFIREGYSSSACTCPDCTGDGAPLGKQRGVGSLPNLHGAINESAKGNQLGLEVMLSLINGPMQSVIDSKDEKIRNLERCVERLECENRLKNDQKPGDATKIFTLEKTLESCVRQIEQLEEANKTAYEKVTLLEDLRKNDKECIDILRVQTSELEKKLSQSDERVREVEKDGKNQSQRLKQQYEKRVEELEKSLRAKESKMRDYDKIRSRVVKQKQELEDRKNSENELHTKMCEQVLELKRELQFQQTKTSILEREKNALTESLSKSENLQRQDQKSSYVLQMKIVELQEKLEGSYRKGEELSAQLEESNARVRLLEDRLRNTGKSFGRWSGDRVNKDNQSCASERALHLKPEKGDPGSTHTKRRPDNSGKASLVFNRHMDDVLREKAVELHDKFYKGQQRVYDGDRSSSEEHIENLSCGEDEPVQDSWGTGNDYNTQAASDRSVLEDGNVSISPRKMEMVFTGDKRRPSSDDCSSSSSGSSATCSRRGSSQSPRTERRQLKVLKVRKVSKENITQFQQNTSYIMSLGRHQARKEMREDPSGSSGTVSCSSNRSPQFSSVTQRPPKEHMHKI